MNRQDGSFFSECPVSPVGKTAINKEEGPMAIVVATATAARRRMLPLAIWLILCIVTAAWYLHVTPPTYTAAATVILDPKRPATPMGDAAAGVLAPALDAAAAESQIQVIRSERLLSFVFDQLDLAHSMSLRPAGPGLISKLLDSVARFFRTPREDEDDKQAASAAAYDAFTGRVGARRVGQSYVIEVSYSSGDPTEARRLANAVVSGYLAQQVSFKLAAAQNGAEFLQGRITALSNEVTAANAGMMAGSVPATLLPDADARVIGAALEPLGRSAPKSGLVVGFAIFFGLLSGVFGVAILNGLDRRIRSVSQLEQATSLPCLGSIPDHRRRKSSGKRSFIDMARLARREPDSRFASAVREIRTSILLAAGGKSGHALGVTSWSTGTGRSLIASNLAEVVALSGVAITLVDANIHSADGGLTAMVPPVGISLTESLLDPSGRTMADEVHLDDDLYLVPARSVASIDGFNAYLGAPGLPLLIEGWRQRGDVIVDLPALGTSGDARAAAAYLDGVAIVVEAERTTIDEVEQAISTLRRAGVTVVGTILNRSGT